MFASGSSALEIAKGSHDLSRRALSYRMHGLSFREYLGLNSGVYFDRISLATLLEKHQHTADSIITRLAGLDLKVLALFKEYLATGYYPYFNDYNDKGQFYLTIEQNIHTTLEADLPAIHQTLTGASIHKIKRLLAIVALTQN